MSPGRLQWVPGKGFEVIINAVYCSVLPDQGRWVIDHELAHIATALKYDDRSHGKTFREVCKFIRGNKCLSCKYCKERKNADIRT